MAKKPKKINFLSKIRESRYNYLTIVFVLAVLFLAIKASPETFTGAVTYDSVQCDWTWPQEVIIDGTSYSCDYSVPYCYSPGRSQGIAQCCNWNEASGYSGCVDIGPEPDAETCTETGDSGIDYDTKGIVTDTETSWVGSQWTDVCTGDQLTEFFCDSNDDVQLVEHDCDYGCENGVCLEEIECDPECPDGYICEDDGVCRLYGYGVTCSHQGDVDSYYMKGSVIDTQTHWIGYQWTDSCDISTGELTEFYCDESIDDVALFYYDCEHGCEDAYTCRRNSPETPPPPEPETEIEADGVEGQEEQQEQEEIDEEAEIAKKEADKEAATEEESEELDVQELDDLDEDDVAGYEEEEQEGVDLGDASGTTCTPAELRCNEQGNAEMCNHDGTDWTFVEYCNYGCENGVCTVQEPDWQDGNECYGEANQCSLYGTYDCEEHPGCSVDGFWFWKWCDGVPASCSQYLEESMCENQGCTWDVPEEGSSSSRGSSEEETEEDIEDDLYSGQEVECSNSVSDGYRAGVKIGTGGRIKYGDNMYQCGWNDNKYCVKDERACCNSGGGGYYDCEQPTEDKLLGVSCMDDALYWSSLCLYDSEISNCMGDSAMKVQDCEFGCEVTHDGSNAECNPDPLGGEEDLYPGETAECSLMYDTGYGPDDSNVGYGQRIKIGDQMYQCGNGLREHCDDDLKACCNYDDNTNEYYDCQQPTEKQKLGKICRNGNKIYWDSACLDPTGGSYGCVYDDLMEIEYCSDDCEITRAEDDKCNLACTPGETKCTSFSWEVLTCTNEGTWETTEKCDVGCTSGECDVVDECYDSDSGITTNWPGHVIGRNPDSPTEQLEVYDECTDDESLLEYFCYDLENNKYGGLDVLSRMSDCSQTLVEGATCEVVTLGYTTAAICKAEDQCIYDTPHKIIVDNVKYECPSTSPYCGIDEKKCCSYSTPKGYYNCVSLTEDDLYWEFTLT
jgi:hypothetical protein